jgi:hypothetical protein
MPQLSMKQLDERLQVLEEPQDMSGDSPDLYTRVAALEQEMPAQFEFGVPGPDFLYIVEALIEALHGVRLAGAHNFALALEAKYFPPEEVDTDGDETA